MTKSVQRRSLCQRVFKCGPLSILAIGAFSALLLPCFAADSPKPDPAGIATGDKTTVVDAGGNGFVVSEPTDKNAPDYLKNKKDFEDFQAQAVKEPLALKLADSVGHLRIGTNFAWTLNTGYLVLFMQAGFALLTCGLVRKKNAGHLMMLNFAAYVFAFLAYYAVGYAFQFGAVAVNAAPGNLGGMPTLNHFLIGGGQWGFLGGNGFFLSGPAYDAGSNCLTLFEVVFMETAGYIIVGSICERITFWALLALRAFHRRDPIPGLRLLGVGRRMAVAGRHLAQSRTWLCRFRRFHRGARRGRLCRHGTRGHPGSTSRQIRQRRKTTRLSSPQPGVRSNRHFHPSVRLDGL